MSPSTVAINRSARPQICRGILVVLGAAVLAYVVWGPPLDAPQAQARPLARAVAAAGTAAVLFGLAWGTSWQRCAGILGGAITGQACTLSLIDAPNYTVLQHYFPWRELLVSRPLFVAALLVQSGAILALVWRRRPVAGLPNHLLRPSRKLALAAAMVVISVNISFPVPRYAGELAIAGWVMVLHLAWIALAANAIPDAALQRVVRWIECDFERSAWDRRLPALCALAVLVTSASLCWFVFGRVPHVPDEVSYLFQAKYFAAGKLYLPAPPDAESFKVGQVFTDGQKWYGYGFPGWPAMLSLGVRLGIPWAVNPILGALIVLLAHRLITVLDGRRTAHAAALLLAASPWFLFMSASFMTHNLSLSLTLAGFLALEKQKQSGNAMWSGLAGLCLGGVVLTRPLEGVVAGLVMGIWSLGLGGARLPFPKLLVFSVVSVALGSLILPYNRVLTGSALLTPQQVWTDATFYPGSDRLGFGANIGNWGWKHLDPFPGHGARDVLINVHQNLYMSNFELFGWGFGSLLFVIIAVLLGRVIRSDRLFLALVVGVAAAQSFYWFGGGPDYGARYWYQMLIPFVVLTIRGIQEIQRRWVRQGGTRLGAQRIAAFAACASLVSAITLVPWRGVGKYHNFRRVRSEMRDLAAARDFGKALVFVGGNNGVDYPSAFVFNPATLDSPDTIYVRDKGPAARDVLRKHFPDRPAWFVTRSETGNGFVVTAGPLAALTPDAKGH